MLFRQSELVRWFGVSVFEIWVWLFSLSVFSVLVVLKVENLVPASTSWFTIFSPLFVSDGVNAYFCIIVFIRQYLYHELRNGPLRTLWSLLVIVLLFGFKYLLCQKLNESIKLEYSEVTSPVFILLVLVMVRACQLH
jgi:ribonuclease P/MRP protein subunit RPP20